MYVYIIQGGYLVGVREERTGFDSLIVHRSTAKEFRQQTTNIPSDQGREMLYGTKKVMSERLS